MTASVHARGIVIAGALAALALALGFVTLAMNQTASQAAPPHVILPLKDRHHGATAVGVGVGTPVAQKTGVVKKAAAVVKKKVVVKHVDPNLVAALKAGLPRSVAEALAKRPVVVVELSSSRDPVGALSAGEAKAGAALGGAAFVGVNVDQDGGAAGVLTTALGKLPDAPAALVYTRPSTLVTTLDGFNDRTAIQQAVTSATPDVTTTVVDAGADWTTKANAICSATETKVRGMGGASKLTFAQGQTIYGAMSKQLAALTPPAASKAAVASGNALLRQSIALLGQAHAKQVAGQVATPTYNHATAVLNQWAAKYDKLGATACTSKT